MKAKKIVSLLLVAAMTVSMAACGGNDQASNTKNDTAADNAVDEAGTEAGDASSDEAEDEALADKIPEETVALEVLDQIAD